MVRNGCSLRPRLTADAWASPASRHARATPTTNMSAGRWGAASGPNAPGGVPARTWSASATVRGLCRGGSVPLCHSSRTSSTESGARRISRMSMWTGPGLAGSIGSSNPGSNPARATVTATTIVQTTLARKWVAFGGAEKERASTVPAWSRSLAAWAQEEPTGTTAFSRSGRPSGTEARWTARP